MSTLTQPGPGQQTERGAPQTKQLQDDLVDCNGCAFAALCRARGARAYAHTWQQLQAVLQAPRARLAANNLEAACPPACQPLQRVGILRLRKAAASYFLCQQSCSWRKRCKMSLAVQRASAQ